MVIQIDFQEAKEILVADQHACLLFLILSWTMSLLSSGSFSITIRGSLVTFHCSFHILYFLSKILAACKITMTIIFFVVKEWKVGYCVQRTWHEKICDWNILKFKTQTPVSTMDKPIEQGTTYGVTFPAYRKRQRFQHTNWRKCQIHFIRRPLVYFIFAATSYIYI